MAADRQRKRHLALAIGDTPTSQSDGDNGWARTDPRGDRALRNNVSANLRMKPGGSPDCESQSELNTLFER